jgi:hypothetical protein
MVGLPASFPRALNGRPVTIFRGNPRPGSSGGPIVDARGRVIATVFGGGSVAYAGFGVPNRFVLSALLRARGPVQTGSCESHGR